MTDPSGALSASEEVETPGLSATNTVRKPITPRETIAAPMLVARYNGSGLGALRSLIG